NSETMRGYFKVYFKTSSTKYVSIKGKTGVIWLALFVFVVGVIMLIGPIIFYKRIIVYSLPALLNRCLASGSLFAVSSLYRTAGAGHRFLVCSFLYLSNCWSQPPALRL